MNAAHRACLPLGALGPLFRTPITPHTFRAYSTAAPASPDTAPSVPPSDISPPPVDVPSDPPSSAETSQIATPAPAPTYSYSIYASVLLSRPPLLTAVPTPFEQSFYFYQRRLNQRLSLPFTRYFYFKKDTPADLEWKRKQKKFEGEWTGFGPTGWKDELMVGDNRHIEEDFGYRRLVERTVTGEEGGDGDEGEDGSEGSIEAILEKKKPLSRLTEADLKGDRKRLDRKLDRTLYLVVKLKDELECKPRHHWRFPFSALEGSENLREAAQRTLAATAGVNMNTWFVGNVPVGHWTHVLKAPNRVPDKGRKMFFMKARILAGQANLKDNALGYDDFLWLTKDEIREVVNRDYWEVVQHMLAAR